MRVAGIKLHMLIPTNDMCKYLHDKKDNYISVIHGENNWIGM